MSEFSASHFILDFAEEADELLGRLGRHLLDLGSGPQREARLEEMLRELHTLKGLCGMVGLEGSARLSHLLESALGRVRSGRLEVTPTVLDLLLATTRKLTEAVAASSAGTAEPDSADLAAALEELLGEESHLSDVPAEVAQHLGPADQTALTEAREAGLEVGLAWFVPSPELVEEGWNVSRVRAHLEGAGQLLKAVPLVSGTSVRFAFLLAHPPGLPPTACPGLQWSSLAAAPASPPLPPLPRAPEAPEPEGVVRPLMPTVRVEVSRLDDIMRLVGDLIVSRWTLQTTLQGGSRDVMAKMERQLRDLRRAVTRARMVPLGETFQRMPLVVRELARSSGKEVRLTTSGEETQVDKVLVERLVDPLLHLVRNSLAHGFESPAERVAAGKPEVGHLTLAAKPDGDAIVITVADDGRGLDLAGIGRRAGLKSPPTVEEALDIITRPGFSTRTEAGLDAGRGVGLDVVRRSLEEIGATVQVASRPGQGCTFSLRVPLTLAIIEAFLLRVGTERYAVARDAVQEVLDASEAGLSATPRGELLAWRGGTLPVVRLGQLLECQEAAAEGLVGLVHVHGNRRVVFLADRVLGLREVVVRPLVDPLLVRPWLTGATELGDGGIALILDLPHLTALAARQRQAVPA